MGLECRLIQTGRDMYSSMVVSPPDCTLSFNDLTQERRDLFLCDLFKIPHLSYLVDSAHRFLHLTSSPYSLLASVDRFDVEFLRAAKCPYAFFLPHAVDESLAFDALAVRHYDVTMLSSFIDYEAIMEECMQVLPASLTTVMKRAADIAREERSLSIIQSFQKAWNEPGPHRSLDGSTINSRYMLDRLVDYIQGKERVELLKSIKDVRVDVFGSDCGGWEKYLGKRSHITYHHEVSFEEAHQIMRESKIVVNSCAWIRNGAHERIFSAMACGALVIAESNSYLCEQFADGESIGFYHLLNPDALNERIAGYLSDESKRGAVSLCGKEIVLKEHTWNQRARQLIAAIQPIVDKMQKEKRSLR